VNSVGLIVGQRASVVYRSVESKEIDASEGFGRMDDVMTVEKVKALVLFEL
jgi:hypothetical protein